MKPIQEMFVTSLSARSARWKTEQELNIPARVKLGPIDISTNIGDKLFAVEWDTGNISSSHRALNKMAMGLLTHVLVGGMLIMPTRKMHSYLTDRVGNFEELAPYFDVWKSLSIQEGLLGGIAVEHDGVSKQVPKFHKGTDGRTLQ